MLLHLPKPVRRAVRHRRGVTTWVVLFAFAAIAIPGHGLHLLPGMDHFQGGADGSGLEMAQLAQNAGWNVSHDGSLNHADDCLICHFVAQGKISPPPLACVSCDATVTYLATADCSLILGHCDQPFYARGPPEG